jgi:hypothetical protein
VIDLAPHQIEDAFLVSVLLPAWNEAPMLGRCLDSLLAITSPNLEIIVCAGGTDGTSEIARQYATANPGRVNVLEQVPGEGKQSALRRAYRCSRGEVIYLTDADCVIPAETLRALVGAIGRDGVDAATGPTHPLPEQRDVPWIRHQWATTHAVDRTRGRESTGLHGRNCAVRREAIEAAGAFTEDVRIGTDYHLAQRLLAAGRTIYFVPAPVETMFETSVPGHAAQQSRWMRNILVHSGEAPDRADVMSVARSMVLGAGLLAWPLTWRRTKLAGLLLWLVPMVWMTRVRLQQDRQLAGDFELQPLHADARRAALFSLADLYVWTRPLIDLLSPNRRFRW